MNNAEHLKKFVFINKPQEEEETLIILIPELQSSSYSYYTWPSAPILAWFLWERRNALVGRRIIELGAGTSLPGILAAKCGAHVTLTDSCVLPKSLQHIEKCCLANNLVPGRDIDIVGVKWGLLLNSILNLDGFDLIIAADCFYDPSIFEDILVTVSFLIDQNPQAKFIFAYQERSADWSIEVLLKKWNLHSVKIQTNNLGQQFGIDLHDLMNNHTIHLIEISR